MHRGWLIILAHALGCTPSPEGGADAPRPTTTVAPMPPPAASPVPAPAVTPSGEPVAEITLGEGSYRSEPCGERKYARVIVIHGGERITVEDHVSPCPAGTACVWSGVVIRKGTYRVEGPASLGRAFTLRLQLGEPSQTAGATPPDHLEWYESRGSLTEPGDRCAYRAE